MKKKYLILLLCAVCFCTGCGKTEKETEPQETILTIEQNDYAGGYHRASILIEDVKNVLLSLEKHNEEVMRNNPSDYWSEEEFYHLDFSPFEHDSLGYITLLNEIDNFSDLQTYITSLIQAGGYSNVSVVRKDKDKYAITYKGDFVNEYDWTTQYGYRNMDCIYDPHTNSLQVSSVFTFSNQQYEDYIYEFAEIKQGVYALQDDTDRLYAVYDEQGNMQEFYYSRLKEDYEEVTEETEEKNDLDYMFGSLEGKDKEEDILVAEWKNTKEKDSIFNDLNKCSADWALEKENLKTVITYKDDVLYVKTINELTGADIEFTYKETIMID